MNQQAKDRVAIAKDALAWLKAGALKAGHTYIRPTGVYPMANDERQLRDVNLGKCTVCALGSLFIAEVVRFDDFRAGMFQNDCSTVDRMKKAIERHFSLEQMTMIEDAYEGWGRDPNSRYATGEFYHRYLTSEMRLVAILENIIKNKGTFVP
jgi:hypothetical protein